MEMERMTMEMQQAREKHAMEMQKLRVGAGLQVMEHSLEAQAQQRAGQQAERSHEINLEGLAAKAKAQRDGARNKPNGERK